LNNVQNVGRDGWVATVTAGEAAAAFLAAHRTVVLTHARPDGDALGSTLALVRALKHAGRDAEAWFVGPMPRFAAALVRDTKVRVAAGAEGAAALVSSAAEPGAVAVVDTGSWMQIDVLGPWLRERADKAVVVDHHLGGDADTAPRRLLDTAAAAAAEVIAPVCAGVLGVPVSRLPRDVAEALFLGCATDTGWFKFSNTRPATLRLAADLLDAGVDHAAVYEVVEQQDRPARLKLLGRALDALAWYGGGRVAVMTLTRADFDSTGGDAEDAGGFASDVLNVAGAQVAVVLTEVLNPGKAGGATVKVSTRSKPGPNAVDVAAVCATLGGGGHARAAGVKLAMPMDKAKAAVLRALGVAEAAGGCGGGA
jgi:phosphoesterase RecJ-like protein